MHFVPRKKWEDLSGKLGDSFLRAKAVDRDQVFVHPLMLLFPLLGFSLRFDLGSGAASRVLVRLTDAGSAGDDPALVGANQPERH